MSTSPTDFERVPAVSSGPRDDSANDPASELPFGLRAEDFEQTVAQMRAAAQATTNYVRDKPLQSIGIAAGIGLLLGVLARRRL